MNEHCDNTSEAINEIDNKVQNLQLSKDLIQLQKKLVCMQSLSVEIYGDIENIQKKYGLKTIDDLLNSID